VSQTHKSKWAKEKHYSRKAFEIPHDSKESIVFPGMILKLQLDVVQESYSFGHVEHVGQRKRYIASAVGGDRSREN